MSRSTRRIEGDERTGGTGVRPLFGRETRRAEHAGLSEITENRMTRLEMTRLRTTAGQEIMKQAIAHPNLLTMNTDGSDVKTILVCEEGCPLPDWGAKP